MKSGGVALEDVLDLGWGVEDAVHAGVIQDDSMGRGVVGGPLYGCIILYLLEEAGNEERGGRGGKKELTFLFVAEDQDGSILSGHSKLVQKLLESVLGLQLSCSGDGVNAQLHFQHGPTGFSFNLVAVHDTEIAELVGGGELMYQNVSLGVYKKAVDWMKEKEVIFGIDQAQLLFKRLIRFFNRGFHG